MNILIHYQSWHVLPSIVKPIPSAQQLHFNHIKGTPANTTNLVTEANNSCTWMNTQGGYMVTAD